MDIFMETLPGLGVAYCLVFVVLILAVYFTE